VQQTIREIGGGNFIHRFSQVSVPLDPVGALNLDTLGMRVARVRMDREDWEPVNDNDGTYHHVASSEAGTLQPVQVLNVTGGATEVTLMPRSVKVLTTQAP
jgi:hypothetical protein